MNLAELRAAWLKAEAELKAADLADDDEAFVKALGDANRANAEYAAAFQKNHGAER